MQYTVNLPAGQWVRQQTAGRFFMIVEDGGQPLAVKLAIPLATDEEVSTANKGFKVRVGGIGFTHVDMRAPVACQVVIVISHNDVDYNFFEGAQVNATIVNPIPVPVTNDRGAPGSPVYVAGLTYSDAPATAVTNAAAVAVTAAGVAILADNPSRKAVRFCNLGADAVALGGPGLTWVQRCIVLEPGDVWVEERGANVAWAGVCDAGKTASVTAQEVIA